MFRVPQDGQHPSMNATYKVGFGQWLKSTRKQREEWLRRRTAAKFNDRHDPVHSNHPAWTPAPTVQQQVEAREKRSTRRWSLFGNTLIVLQLIPLVMVMLACVGGSLWFAFWYATH